MSQAHPICCKGAQAVQFIGHKGAETVQIGVVKGMQMRMVEGVIRASINENMETISLAIEYYYGLDMRCPQKPHVEDTARIFIGEMIRL